MIAMAVGCLGCGAEAIHTQPPLADPQHRAGVVTEAAGAAVSEGDLCDLTITPHQGRVFNCRIQLRCGTELLYGLPGAGYNRCQRVGGQLRGAQDNQGTREDGDPILQLDFETGVLTLEDSDPLLRLEVALERR